MTENEKKGLSWGEILVLLLFSLLMGPGMIVFSFSHYQKLQNPPPGMKVRWLEYVLINTLGAWSILALGLLAGAVMSVVALGGRCCCWCRNCAGSCRGSPAAGRRSRFTAGDPLAADRDHPRHRRGDVRSAGNPVPVLQFDRGQPPESTVPGPDGPGASALPADPAEVAALEALKKFDVFHHCDDKQPGQPVVELTLSRLIKDRPSLTDADLVHLKAFPNLRVLRLSTTPIDGSGLVHLRGLDELQELGLGFTNITDVNLVHLEGFRTLQRLDLAWTKISNSGLSTCNRDRPARSEFGRRPPQRYRCGPDPSGEPESLEARRLRRCSGPPRASHGCNGPCRS